MGRNEYLFLIPRILFLLTNTLHFNCRQILEFTMLLIRINVNMTLYNVGGRLWCDKLNRTA